MTRIYRQAADTERLTVFECVGDAIPPDARECYAREAESDRAREARIALYRDRLARGLDLWTGFPNRPRSFSTWTVP